MQLMGNTGELVYRHNRLEAHKCELGTLTREALVTIESGPNTSGGRSVQQEAHRDGGSIIY